MEGFTFVGKSVYVCGRFTLVGRFTFDGVTGCPEFPGCPYFSSGLKDRLHCTYFSRSNADLKHGSPTNLGIAFMIGIPILKVLSLAFV